jgi:DNA polymerase III psi subunit
MAIENHDGTISVTGTDVSNVAGLIRLRGWKLAADMKIKHGMSSKHCPSVKAFNAEYGTNAKSWAQIQKITTDVLADIRAELDAAKTAQSAK